MAIITPSAAFLRRIVPAALIEAVCLGACVFAYLQTNHIGWIIAAGAVAAAFGLWVVMMVIRHSGEWRWNMSGR